MKKYLQFSGLTVRLIFLLFIFTSAAQDSGLRTSVDYNPVSLHKEAARIFGEEFLEIKEFPSGNVTEGISGKFFTVQATDQVKGYAYIGRVNSCRAGGCATPRLQATAEESEYFDYFTLYDSLKSVLLVKVFNYQASHGQEITARGWLRQFKGYNGTSELEVGRQVDAISGATISVYGIVEDVREKTKLLKNI
jgi:hypothetical protein